MGAPFAPPPPAAVSRLLGEFDRAQIEAFIEVAIRLVDLADGDSDVELNGDELDGINSEDDFMDHSHWQLAPGCPIADPGGCEHDGREIEDCC